MHSVIKEDELFNLDAVYKALNIVYKTQMFESSRLIQMPDFENMLVDVEILVKEKPAKTVEVALEWQLQPGLKGRQKVLDIVPGGSLVIENYNLRKTGAQASAMISTQNFFHMNDITDFKATFKMPYCRGIGDIKKTSLNIDVLQTHRLSPVFSPIARPEVTPIWNNRVGMKASLHESYSQASKASWSVIAESISCLDESGTLCTMVADKYPGKELKRHIETGLPTTLSGSGHDRIVLLRNDTLRDTTYINNHALLGDIDVCTSDLGLGIHNSFQLFYRYSNSMTRFIPIARVPVLNKSTASLVLHGKFGDSIGNIAPYDYTILGGPFSCRGYMKGEIGLARRFFETAVEFRYPLPKLGWEAYLFMEHANSLNSSSELPGDPNAYYRLSGKGTSYGYGIKLAAIRFEYARDCSIGKGTLFVRFGNAF
jgi:outer membrane protein assembly factor BamA